MLSQSVKTYCILLGMRSCPISVITFHRPLLSASKRRHALFVSMIKDYLILIDMMEWISMCN